jgi:basic amino acid/polyamine antiporter, APA family
MSFFRTKPFHPEEPDEAHHLRQVLTATDLILLGIGAIIGAGIFVITGIAAATKAGPAVSVSYIIAGVASLLSALCYAELAASVGGCGSAYSYSYASFGEVIAWVIGWDLILEYSMSVSTVAIGWSGYVVDAFRPLNIPIPVQFTTNPFEGGIVNLPAVSIIILLSILLCYGVKQSARFNALIVFIKLAVIGIFILVGISHFNRDNWIPFIPFGWTGIMHGAALVFFAYIGFDAVSTTAEEAIDPQRDLPIGIIWSVIVCTILYIVVAGLLTAIVPYHTLNVSSPVADALLRIGHPFASGLVAFGAIAGLTSVMLVMYYGLTRVFLAISRDGLLPKVFSEVHPYRRTPIVIILFSGTIMALIAGFVPIAEAAQMVNIGTLSAFALVCGGVIVLRNKYPHARRPFKVSFYPMTPLLGLFFCLYLMVNLSDLTLARFITWLVLGLFVYFFYGKEHSSLERHD